MFHDETKLAGAFLVSHVDQRTVVMAANGWALPEQWTEGLNDEAGQPMSKTYVEHCHH